MGDEERPAAPLAIALLGPWEVWLAGQPLSPLRSQKSQWLLALLALQRGRPVERAWLAGTLWPDSSDRQAAFNLTRNLSDLRHALGPEARRLDAPSGRTLRLDLIGAEADVLIFDEAVARGDLGSLEQAVALRRGPLLQGCQEEWVLPERQAREEAYRAALEGLAEAARARGDLGAAVQYLQRLVALDPLRDSAQRALMLALAAGGEFAAATQVYREFRLRLHRELNAAPDPETVATYEQIRSEVRQRLVAAAPASAAPAASVGPRREATARLPQPLTRLVGREQEVREIRARLAAERLVTLTGPGGVGKTRLAIQVAAECRGEFQDGVWFVDLAALPDPALVSQAVARALEVREAADRPLATTLQEVLGTRQLLLVLDNCEHLLASSHDGGGCAALAEALLVACPELWVLATSRQPLGLTGEIVWQVPSLALPPAPAGGESAGACDLGRWRGTEPISLERLLKYEALRLFVERGKAVRPGFALTQENGGAAVQICRRLDGIPLAIELAAARLKVLSPEEIAARLDDRFSLLVGGNRTALPRHQTLRATMDWSYELLSEPERALLRRLSVFAGRFRLEAAEAVCAEPKDEGYTRAAGVSLIPEDVLDRLTSLVDKSLVVVDAHEGAYPRSGCTHYRLLETVRQYTRERLRESGEEAAVRRRHVAFYLRLAEQTETSREGPDHIARLGRLDAVLDNLRAALDSSLQDAPETALRLAAALAGYWEDRGHLAEGRRWLAAALERAQRSAGGARRSPAGAAALDGASALALLQEDRRSAQLLLEESLVIRRELGDRAGIATSLAHLGYVSFLRDDYPAARHLYEESLAIRRELGDQPGIAAVLTGLGNVARRSGEYQEARSLQEESLAIRRALGDQYGISQTLIGLGDAVLELGDTAAARAHYEEALAIRRDLGDRGGVAGVLGVLADVARREGDSAAARRLREEGLAVWRDLGCQVAVLHWLGALGHVARDQGEFREAHRFYAESLLLRKELGDPYTITQSLEDYAELAAAERQWTRMTRLLGAAQALRDAIEKPLRPPERADYERLRALACAALSEETVAAASEEGRAMICAHGGSAEPAIAFALQELSPAQVGSL